ncbi:MAG: tRNA 2-thiouridine(34) synthase MnmA [Candidatus Pacebacteria bacterium]|nr:tRNA 2-thiouridine(34) synthase MnmA [Candidatus Paceibacterota bacterium]
MQRTPKTAIAMSGGTDSSMAAHLLREQGHDLIGITLRLWPMPSSKSSDQHVTDARRVAAALGIEHHVYSLYEYFEEAIVSPFVDAYATGTTPSPCIMCNVRVKFGAMLRKAEELGCARLATGHYARIVEHKERRHVARGLDPAKDQSYFLFALSQDQLEHALFPLGSLNKKDVAAEGRALGLVPHNQSESQDLCFIADGDYVNFIAQRRPDLCRPGPITDKTGHVLGRHNGFFKYTIGQRRGLGLGGGPWYVSALRPETNTVEVGRLHDVQDVVAGVDRLNWQCQPPAPGSVLRADVQLRYAMRPVQAAIHIGENTMCRLQLSEHVTGITPGQAAVFYDDDRIIGGGWIR